MCRKIAPHARLPGFERISSIGRHPLRQLVLSRLRPADGRSAKLHLRGHCGTDWRLALEGGSAVARVFAVVARDGGRLLESADGRNGLTAVHSIARLRSPPAQDKRSVDLISEALPFYPPVV